MYPKFLKNAGKRLVDSFVLVCLLFSVTNPISIHAAPPPPTDPAPLIEPQGQSTAPTQPAPSAPVADAFEEQRAKMAMEMALDKYLETLGPRYTTGVIEVSLDGDWALGVAQWKGNARTFNGPLNILAHRQHDGSWMAMLPNVSEEFTRMVENVPFELVPIDIKDELIMQAKEDYGSEYSRIKLTSTNNLRIETFSDAFISQIFLVDEESGMRELVAAEKASDMPLPMFEKFITISPDENTITTL